MNNLIKKITPTLEFIIVLIIGFGLFIYNSTRQFFTINTDYSQTWLYKITSSGHYSILIYEVIAALLIIYILKVRNWKLSDFNLSFVFKLIWIALLLIIIRNLITNTTFSILKATNILSESATKHVEYGVSASWISIALIIVFNSIYEEFLLIGYFFKRLEKYNPILVIVSSTLLRLSYHTYQGWISIIAILPLGIVFGIYYYKYKKLWTIIIAHGLINLITYLSLHFNWQESIESLRD